jgi:hypothetical protein
VARGSFSSDPGSQANLDPWGEPSMPVILWLLGVPIGLIILLMLFGIVSF